MPENFRTSIHVSASLECSIDLIAEDTSDAMTDAEARMKEVLEQTAAHAGQLGFTFQSKIVYLATFPALKKETDNA